MKLVLSKLLLLLLFVSVGCHHGVSPEQNNTADFNYTDDLGQAKMWFGGEWKLTAISAMISNPAVPNVRFVVSNNQITVIQDEKQIDQVSFEIVKTLYNFQLKTTAQPKGDNWYLRNPILRVSRNRLFLDTGIALDLPGFGFERTK